MRFVLTILLFSFSVKAISSVEVQFNEAVAEGNCLESLPAARALVKESQNHVKALQEIARCTAKQHNANIYAAQAKELFEGSKVLSIVPKLLEMAKIKELVPIMKEVEVKEDKGLADYLFLNEVYDRLGQPDKQIRALENAVKISKDDPRPLLLLASKKMDTGDREGAQKLFSDYLFNAPPHAGRAYLWAYVAAMAYPTSVSFFLVFMIWGLGLLITKRKMSYIDGVDDVDFEASIHKFKIAKPMFLLILPVILAFRFWHTGKALPFGALLLIVAVQVFTLFKGPIKKVTQPAVNKFKKVCSVVFNGVKLANAMTRISKGWRIMIALSSLFVLGTIVPTIKMPDLKYSLMAICTLFFYATLGSLIVTFLRSSRSLQVSMRWIGVAATLPFLMSYVVSNWNDLGLPLMYARLPSSQALNSLVNYLVFWGVSLGLALHLSKILAEALIQPVRHIMEKVARIEKGDFEAKVDVLSKDEIGDLGQAVNRMGDGLKQREQIEQTFHRYVDPDVAERIINGGEDEVRIEGQKMNAVIMFVDIRGFTSMSEKMQPEQVVERLNGFFERTVKIIKENNGVIDKFIGDNMMAVWGVPSSIKDPELKAVTAATQIREAVVEWNKELEAQGQPLLGIGVGINTGPVVAGSIGSPDRMEYTVIGDTVNTAQRAESKAKPQQILLTESMYNIVSENFEFEKVGPYELKGKAEAQYFWAVKAEKQAMSEAA